MLRGLAAEQHDEADAARGRVARSSPGSRYNWWVRLTLDEIARVTGGAAVGSPAVVVDGATMDSRALRPGQLFVALRGERDGHDFVDCGPGRRRRRPSWPSGTSTVGPPWSWPTPAPPSPPWVPTPGTGSTKSSWPAATSPSSA